MTSDNNFLVQVCSPGPLAFLAGGRGAQPFDPRSDGVRLTFDPNRALQFDSVEARRVADFHTAYHPIRLDEVADFVGNDNHVSRETWAKASSINCIVWTLFQWGAETRDVLRGIGLPGRRVDIAISTNGSTALRWDTAWAVGIWDIDPLSPPTINQGVYRESNDETGTEYDFHADKPDSGDWGYTIRSRGPLFANMAYGMFVPRDIMSEG